MEHEMVSYSDLLSGVAERAGLERAEQARTATAAVLTAVAQYGQPQGRAALADVLPSQFAEVIKATTRRDSGNVADFLGLVASAASTTPERARYLSQAVLSYLADVESQATQRLRADLPDEFADLFTPPGQGPPPERAATAANDVPTQLTPDEVTAALRRLPGWEGDTHRLRRTVALPPGHDRLVLDRIRQAEADLNHHAERAEGPDGLTITVWTHSRGLVTDLDVRLAQRISEAIETPGGGR